jgi:protein gp37
MAKNSKIEWTHHTFNPWWGCTKVSPACTHCYADTFATRIGHGKRLPLIWGPRSSRRFFGDAHWTTPVTWNDDAKRTAKRARVFCASMADVFEPRTELVEHRRRLFRLIEETPYLDWLLLTKRPEHANLLARECGWTSSWPTNVWAGATVENQRYADLRIPALAALPATVRFLSSEPLLGPLALEPWFAASIHWVIVGGESGHGARKSKLEWVRSVRDQCVAANVPFHFKQWGAWVPRNRTMVKVAKKAAGRRLDGRTWDQFPSTRMEDIAAE